MARKNNIRSIRFSDELADLIDRQIGDTFTQKFENLVTRCVWELPAKEKQLADIQARIDRERQQLSDLQQITKQLRILEQDIEHARNYIGITKRYIDTVIQRAEAIDKATKKAEEDMMYL